MIADLEPYPAMKDSGVEWLGEVPAHWEMRRLRNAAAMRVSNVDKHVKEGEVPIRLCNYVDVYKRDHISQQIDFMRVTATREEIERFRLQEGDVLITKDSEAWDDIGVPALVTEPADDLISGYHLALLRPFADELKGAYLLRALQSKGLAYQFHVQAKGVTRYGLSHTSIKSVWLPLPPLSEQVAIVRYLDHVDRRVRRLVRAKRQLIALLTEQKQAIIHQAVTRGLDPDVPLKDSGVEWLGEVPEHWEVVRTGHLIRLATGFPFKSEDFSQSEGDVRLLRGVNVSPGSLRWEEDVVRWPAADRGEFGSFELARGDIVLGMDRPIISAGIRVAQVTEEDLPCLLLQRVARIRPLAQIDVRFLLHLIAGQGFKDYLTPIFTGVSVPHLSPEQIRTFRFALPPLDEQAAIAERCEEASANIDVATLAAAREIELLNEYRTRLIADVVTGKLDVREAAAALPEVDPFDTEDDVDDALDDDTDDDLDSVPEAAEA